ncbi:inner membrane protein YbiR [Clostridium tepidiprofundi DSM 19306]|uniref:Inner membrane protein YbiR n=1 Tax=Clostridium tepidiprofundi DSM 19306 TaxID=1121338 RepID=A0A151B684_9CLOT|nr:SLC13 family permease [Clostridium tepidiprofundi]KYH35404.1 inner membrane protein YbiR [Clostridium tepidiprofundi DSM 19306]
MKYKLNNTFLNSILRKIKKEIVFSLSFLLAIVTSIINSPKISYIDFKVLFSLFNLMIVVAAFNDLKILDMLAIKILNKFNNSRRISLILILLTFFSAMLITNDVALITFVPLTLITCEKAQFNPVYTIIFQTIAANIGSSLTPMGNPQNLFLFSYFNIKPIEFFKVMLPFVTLGLLWLIVLNRKVKNENLIFLLENLYIKNKIQAIVFSLLFILIILSVFNIINYKLISMITITITLIFNKDLIKKADYFLLLTFICFFIFIGNVSSMHVVKSFMGSILNHKGSTYFSSILLSQIISNVPCSILLAGFTQKWNELLLGVNIGGMGTIIASLASLISYKLYINSANDVSSKKYLLLFHIYNIASLVLFTIICTPGVIP